MAVHMREVLVRQWVGVRVSFALKASSVCLTIRIHFITICTIFSLFEFGSSPDLEGSFYLLMGVIDAGFIMLPQ